jgi:hypothetical protein
MSRSDNTTPYRLWDHYGLTYNNAYRKWRCGPPHRSVIAADVRLASRRERRVAREKLRRGVEPLPYRPRHGVQWEAI